ncbi:hypothetical protein GE061_004769 [Apolygus lucorum]|uniref:G-protein coupled receptors family 1 profile domain-containing protein n=1 Tax=Apolygus lucorum TaxID=248454 RepID=A0A8S9WZM9_APOLU|nr:hypothetical protein GE061_004769 [Apolygus lucorum]
MPVAGDPYRVPHIAPDRVEEPLREMNLADNSHDMRDSMGRVMQYHSRQTEPIPAQEGTGEAAAVVPMDGIVDDSASIGEDAPEMRAANREDWSTMEDEGIPLEPCPYSVRDQEQFPRDPEMKMNNSEFPSTDAMHDYMQDVTYDEDDLIRHYIRERMGPQRLSHFIPTTIVYVAIFFTGVLGNTFVCMTIAINKELHTSTYYYLFSLAVSDLLLLVLGLPYEVSLCWQQYPWPLGTPSCKLRALVSEMASYTSVLTIVAFTMERYVAVCHPQGNYSMFVLHPKSIIGALWVVSLLAASPFSMFTKINYLQYPEGSGNDLPETAFCAMLEDNKPKWLPIYEFSFLLFFLVPMMMIIVLYVLIWMKLSANMNSSAQRDDRHLQSRRNVIRMLIAVVITFFICWCPFHVQRLFYIYGQDLESYLQINEWIFNLSGVLYYLSATMNPILYNLMSGKYRTAFLLTLTCGSYRRSDGRRNVETEFGYPITEFTSACS